MSTKEMKEALESAQKEVLEEINEQRDLFGRIFNKNQKIRLRQIQSWISKALNQLKKNNFNSNDNELSSKLQIHLNEKTQLLKDKEEELLNQKKKVLELEHQLGFCKAELLRLESQSPVIIEPQNNKAEDLEKELGQITNQRNDLERLYKISQDHLNQSQELSIELSARLKKLKTELLSK